MRLPDMLRVLIDTLWEDNIAVKWRLDMVAFPDGTVASKLDNGDFRPSQTKNHAAVINQQIDDLHGNLTNMLDRASYKTHSFRLTLDFKPEVQRVTNEDGRPLAIGAFVMEMRHHVSKEQNGVEYIRYLEPLSLNLEQAKHFAKSKLTIDQNWQPQTNKQISLDRLHQSIFTVGAIIARRCGYQCESVLATCTQANIMVGLLHGTTPATTPHSVGLSSADYAPYALLAKQDERSLFLNLYNMCVIGSVHKYWLTFSCVPGQTSGPASPLQMILTTTMLSNACVSSIFTCLWQ